MFIIIYLTYFLTRYIYTYKVLRGHKHSNEFLLSSYLSMLVCNIIFDLNNKMCQHATFSKGNVPNYFGRLQVNHFLSKFISSSFIF